MTNFRFFSIQRNVEVYPIELIRIARRLTHTVKVMLQAIVLDAEGNALDPSYVTWSSGATSVADVILKSGELTSVVGNSPSGVPVPITARYDDGCQVKEASALIKVACLKLELSSNLVGVMIKDTSGLIKASLVDEDGNRFGVDETKITWSSNDRTTAAVAQ